MELSSRTIQTMFETGYKCLVINGLPGGGKTRYTLHRVAPLARKVKVIYSAPLRSLRDWVAEYVSDLVPNVYVLRSKFEICERVRSELEDEDFENFLQYLYKILTTCAECQDRREGKCEFGRMVYEFIHSRSGFWCMTHHMLYILTLMLQNVRSLTRSIVIIDEAEQFIDLFRYVCDVFTLEKLKKLAARDPAWREVIKRIESSTYRFGYMLFLAPIVPLTRLIILISATITVDNPLLTLLGEDYTVIPHYVRAEVNDIFVRHNRIVVHESVIREGGDEHVVKMDRNFIENFVNIVAELYDHGLSIGIACRSHEQNRMLTDMMKDAGMTVYSEVELRRPPRRDVPPPYVILWTTRGKWYRGVSLPETDVIFCFYQNISGALKLSLNVEPYKGHALSYLISDIDVDFPLLKYQEIVYNVQSYYRTNRIRGKTHMMVFIDRRAHEATVEAFKYMHEESWYEKLVYPSSVDNMVQLRRELLNIVYRLHSREDNLESTSVS